MYNGNMSDTKIKFVFNQTYYYGGKKYQSGDSIQIPKKDIAQWSDLEFGEVYKPKVKKDK
jgi:hypothetical protein